MTDSPRYSYDLEPKFGFLQLMDVPTLVKGFKHEIYAQTLCRLNESVIRVGVIRGELDWHKHDNEDEFFSVLEGKFLIDLEGETVTLGPHQGYAIPKGVRHRTRAPERAAVLLCEKSTVKPGGD